jgi:hypothetical protein
MCSHKADEPTYRVDIEWTLARCKLFVKCLVKDCLMQCLDGEICIDGMMRSATSAQAFSWRVLHRWLMLWKTGEQ